MNIPEDVIYNVILPFLMCKKTIVIMILIKILKISKLINY